MIVIGIDTATRQTSVAIGSEHEIIARASIAGAARQESVTPLLRELLDRSGLTLSRMRESRPRLSRSAMKSLMSGCI